MFLMALMFAFNLHTDICILIAKIDRMHIKKWILVYKMQMDFSVQNAACMPYSIFDIHRRRRKKRQRNG